ncbi:MAG: hypothetical protein E7L01_00990 [Paenibacillus macerans]|uniref:hypothetical protein n=1 Tax=Paenibacillus TaxID=44249 RepID=UPI002430C859|nr:hypothetical protein [Paenibacillus macerans]MBS5910305.1 hypothetical protein [Paenibacillus macerans]MDU7471921.1 hypothetical protein [Paenibacillus macerans]MEC0331115.1 hypothetical protein [Paenibacillus macerans]
MSRSVKKSPVWTDHTTPGTRWSKRQAGKAVRRFTGDMQNGGWYRKLYCSWDICDYKFYKPQQEAIHEWENCRWLQSRSLPRADAVNDWEKHYKRK